MTPTPSRDEMLALADYVTVPRAVLEPFVQLADVCDHFGHKDDRRMCKVTINGVPHDGPTAGECRALRSALLFSVLHPDRDRLAVSASDGVQPRIPDGQQCNEQSAQGLSLATDPDLLALIERAKSNVMTPEEHYEQRRSFVRGMCPSKRDYAEWCAEVDKLLPPLDGVQKETPLAKPESSGADRSESETTIGGTNFCGHGVMASLCPQCSSTPSKECRKCSGTGRHGARFSLDDALCPYCAGSGIIGPSDHPAKAVAETHPRDSSESAPPAVLSDPTTQSPESGAR